MKKRLHLIVLLIVSITLILFACDGKRDLSRSELAPFIIKVDDNENVFISDNKDLQSLTNNLAADGFSNFKATTYENLPDDIDDRDGSYYGMGVDAYKKPATLYFTYTFYIVNAYITDGAKYKMSLNFTQKTKNVDRAIRILLIEDTEYYGIADIQKKNSLPNAETVTPNLNDERVSTIYAAPQPNGNLEKCNSESMGSKGDPDKNFNYNPYDDVSDSNNVFEFNKNNLSLGNIHKYTLVFYIEGWDLDCTEDAMKGSVKMELIISV